MADPEKPQTAPKNGKCPVARLFAPLPGVEIAAQMPNLRTVALIWGGWFASTQGDEQDWM
jgi:hypothetical protein